MTERPWSASPVASWRWSGAGPRSDVGPCVVPPAGAPAECSRRPRGAASGLSQAVARVPARGREMPTRLSAKPTARQVRICANVTRRFLQQPNVTTRLAATSHTRGRRSARTSGEGAEVAGWEAVRRTAQDRRAGEARRWRPGLPASIAAPRRRTARMHAELACARSLRAVHPPGRGMAGAASAQADDRGRIEGERGVG